MVGAAAVGFVAGGGAKDRLKEDIDFHIFMLYLFGSLKRNWIKMATEEGWNGVTEVTALVGRRFEQFRRVMLASDSISNLSTTTALSKETGIVEMKNCFVSHERVCAGSKTQ